MKKSNLWENTIPNDSKFLHSVRASESIKLRSKKRDFLHFLLILLEKHEKASGIKLAGVLVPRPNFVAANLREIENPEERDHKIQNFKLKIPKKKKFENLVRGHRSIFLIADIFEP